MPEILHRCVEKVMAKGHDERSAYAICNANLAGLSDAVTDDEIDAMLGRNSLTAIDPAQVRVLESRSDGSGVVELPILSEEQHIDLGLTATGRAETDKVTSEDLRSAVENFSAWPGPVPVHRAPHRSHAEASGPADGFIERLSVVGKQLWARIELTAGLFGEVVARQWRGFSVDYGRNVKRPSRSFPGFAVARGVFTNQPASDVHFRLEGCLEVGSAFTRLATREQEGVTMDGELSVQLATAQAEVKAGSEKIGGLEAKVGEQRNEITRLEGVISAAEKKAEQAVNDAAQAKLTADRKSAEAKDAEDRIASLEAERKDLRAKLQAKEDETITARVAHMCRSAIKEGVPPARLKVYGDYEKDPLGWLNNNFRSLEAAELTIKALPREAALSVTRSGHDPSADATDSAAVTPQIAAELRRRGLDPKYASLSTSDDLNALKGT